MPHRPIGQLNVWKKRDLIIKAEDKLPKDGRPSDIIIPVMGPSGSGKSTFINTVTQSKTMAVGSELQSCTSNIEVAYLTITPDIWSGLEGRRVVFVDTPGFDDTYVEDVEILRRISVWLAASYEDGMTIAGVIYLHEITSTRMLGTGQKNLSMFHKLCGHEATQNVILVTTKWGLVTEEVGKGREKQLIQSYWKRMIQEGAKHEPFLDDYDSSLRILKTILSNAERNKTVVLRVQKELVELQRLIPETDAGRTLRETLKQILAVQREIEELRKHRGDDAMLRQRLEDNHRQMAKALRQAQELNVPLTTFLLDYCRSFFKAEGYTVLTDGRLDDIIILVLGVKGSGKSTFIKKLLPDSAVKVTHKLDSGPFRIDVAVRNIIPEDEWPRLDGRQIVFVDSPGFDDRDAASNEKIFSQICNWRAKSYYDGMNVSGIIYLHDICQARMQNLVRKTLEDVQTDRRKLKLGGHNIVLVTTKWDPQRDEGNKGREEQLRQDQWKSMIQNGARTEKFHNNEESALMVIKEILSRVEDNDALASRIENEFIQLKEKIPDTRAGNVLCQALEQLLEVKHEITRRMRQSGDSFAKEAASRELRVNHLEIQNILEQIRKLKVPAGRVAGLSLGFHL